MKEAVGEKQTAALSVLFAADVVEHELLTKGLQSRDGPAVAKMYRKERVMGQK